MATYKDVIDRVLKNVGDTRSGNADVRADILLDLDDFLRTELPDLIGGSLVEGSFDLVLGGAGSVLDADGLVAWPARVRSMGDTFQMDDDVPWAKTRVFRDPGLFYGRWNRETPTAGKPTGVLVYGKDLVFRPVPAIGAGDTVYNMRVWGTMYPNVTPDPIVEGTELHRNEDKPILIAWGSVLEAARNHDDETATRWSAIYDLRRSNYRTARNAGPRKAAGYRAYL